MFTYKHSINQTTNHPNIHKYNQTSPLVWLFTNIQTKKRAFKKSEAPIEGEEGEELRGSTQYHASPPETIPTYIRIKTNNLHPRPHSKTKYLTYGKRYRPKLVRTAQKQIQITTQIQKRTLMTKPKKELIYCTKKRTLYEAPCHYAWYDRLFELGVIRCTREPETCQHQKTGPEDTLRKKWQKRCETP